MAILLFWKFERKIPPKLRVCNPKKKREGFGTLCKFSHKNKEKGVVPYTSVFCKDLDYRNWKNKNKRKRIR